ncbi:MAG TPA: hypothetical protein VFY97_11710 [Rhodanobacteraceae bacterium]|nr:hypothetical protein [Rhodanobacteraceae bacterium]
MLAKLTSKNQLTLPKAAVEATGNAEYFEVEAHRDVFDHIERFHNPGM